ncbi:MAG: hypothetical protein AB7E32_03835 [Desulfovibrio sp.]
MSRTPLAALPTLSRRGIVLTLLALLTFLALAHPTWAETDQSETPENSASPLPSPTTPAPAALAPAEEAATLLGLPYHADGVLDDQDRWTYFARPEEVQETPGLNCSGLVVTAARKALSRSLPLGAMLRDRNRDSGPDAPGGQDWDFGFDLVLNVSQGLRRHELTPEGRSDVPENADGAGLRGFALENTEAWKKILPLLRPECPCLLSFSRVRRGRLLHHHVGLLLADASGHVWFEQATRKNGVSRMDLAAPGGIERFLTQQRLWPGTDAHVLIIEVEPLDTAAH